MSGGVRPRPDGRYYLEDGLMSEIVNHDFSPSNCNTIDLELQREHTFGGQIGTKFVMCGGKKNDHENRRKISDNCFSVSSSGKLNNTFANLKFPRFGAASVVINNTLYISGGEIPKNESNPAWACLITASAEIIAENDDKSKIVNNLTQPLSNHCAVLLSNQKIMVIGIVYILGQSALRAFCLIF